MILITPVNPVCVKRIVPETPAVPVLRIQTAEVVDFDNPASPAFKKHNQNLQKLHRRRFTRTYTKCI